MVDADFAHGYCINGHDWAIIEVTDPIIFGVNVRPICLPKTNQEINEILTVVGWGRTTCIFFYKKFQKFSFRKLRAINSRNSDET